MSSKCKGYPIIPAEENKCVWMKTGLVSYKLCDKNYHCETCPFDRAMRNGGSNGLSESLEEELEGSFSEDPSWLLDNDGAILFHPDHCWVKVESHQRVKIGLDALITMLLSRVQLAVLPAEGAFAEEGECFAHIIEEDYVLPVIAPISGKIVETNYLLKSNPGLIASDPKGDGWLATIRPDNLENDLKKLFFGRKALSWKQREEGEITNRIDSLLRMSSPGVGRTMQDGGARVTSLREMLNSITAKQLVQILDSLVSRRHSS